MKKLRNKKRLTILSIVFALTFMVGSVFALVPGHLDVVGTVNVSPGLYVTWETITTGHTAGANVTSTAPITAMPARERTAQRIVWNVNFDGLISGGDTYAYLTATAMNNSLVPVDITAVQAMWLPMGTDIDTMPPPPVPPPPPGVPFTPQPVVPQFVADWGLGLVDLDWASFVGTLNSGVESAPMTVRVTWNGQTPNTFDPNVDIPPTFQLVVAFYYELTPQP